MVNRGGTEGRTDGRTSRNPPCVLQDIGPLGPLPKKEERVNDGDEELVIQGSHMVSSTQCPAGSGPVKRWSESRAAAPKGRCPVEHRGEFPYIQREGLIMPQRANFKLQKPDF